jgi:predicted KAP-like P-loop ATPase
MNTDHPINSKANDQFGRSEFAIQLASMLEMTNSQHSIVAAIYSEWGNGKSSVLNMVDESLSENIIKVRFNPWRYDDQDQLIINFFNSIVESVDTSNFKQKEDLKKKIKKYGASAVPIVKMIPFLGTFSGNLIESVTKMIEEKSTEKFKHELSEILLSEEKRIVVIIDDIDRLDKQEALNLLKLVKLTGDLPFVSYLLAFDKSIISNLISERYSNSGSNSGEKFLEKIVQLPLDLPKIRFDNLHKFTHSHISNTLKEINAEVPVEDYQYFSSHFDKSLISKVKLPRDAIRISNVFRFVIPILSGEVYLPDVMILETIKLFYPSAFQVIEKFPELFVETDKDFQGTLPRFHVPKYDKDKLKEEIYSSCENQYEKEKLEKLLQNIFPLYHQNTSNYNYDQLTRVRWMSGQRVASSKYLNRYLSLSIAKGDIPDKIFIEYLELVALSDDQDILEEKLNELLKTYSLNYIIHRFRSIESDINIAEGLKIGIALARNAHLLDDFESIFISSVGNSSGQSSIFMKSLIARLPNSDRKDWCTKIIDNSSKLEFAATFVDFVVMKPRFEKSLLSEDEIIDLKYQILQKLLKSTGKNSHVFKDFPRMMQTLIKVWNLKDNEGLNEYLENNIFNSKSEDFFDFSYELDLYWLGDHQHRLGRP